MEVSTRTHNPLLMLLRLNSSINRSRNRTHFFYIFGLQAHPPGAINVQIYRLIKEWTAWDIARRAAFAFFGIFAGTEENPEFMQSILLLPNHALGCWIASG